MTLFLSVGLGVVVATTKFIAILTSVPVNNNFVCSHFVDEEKPHIHIFICIAMLLCFDPIIFSLAYFVIQVHTRRYVFVYACIIYANIYHKYVDRTYVKDLTILTPQWETRLYLIVVSDYHYLTRARELISLQRRV